MTAPSSSASSLSNQCIWYAQHSSQYGEANNTATFSCILYYTILYYTTHHAIAHGTIIPRSLFHSTTDVPATGPRLMQQENTSTCTVCFCAHRNVCESSAWLDRSDRSDRRHEHSSYTICIFFVSGPVCGCVSVRVCVSPSTTATSSWHSAAQQLDNVGTKQSQSNKAAPKQQ